MGRPADPPSLPCAPRERMGLDAMTVAGRLRGHRWTVLGVLLLLAAAALVSSPYPREAGLLLAGRALVANDAIGPADIIVVSLDSGGAGVLEAADLVRSGVAKRVAVFSDPPSAEDHEFIRRGLPYEDASERQVRQLKSLGVEHVEKIAHGAGGSHEAVSVLARWCSQNAFGSVVFVTARDHSRRVRRLLDRSMRGHPTHIAVRASRYSQFDPDAWWRTSAGVRSGVVELQKLLLDVALHPVSF